MPQPNSLIVDESYDNALRAAKTLYDHTKRLVEQVQKLPGQSCKDDETTLKVYKVH